MKKLILTTLILTSIYSCKKEHSCWQCEFFPVNGVVEPTREVCTKEMPKILVDSLGNTLPFNCHK